MSGTDQVQDGLRGFLAEQLHDLIALGLDGEGGVAADPTPGSPASPRQILA